MADDARISTALPRHPKTVKLLRRLHEPGFCSLVFLWLWVRENRPDGNLADLTSEDLEIAAGWTGEPGAFVSTLAEVRFLDGAEAAYTVHDWAEHNPWAVNQGRRIAAARAAANIRWERVAQATGSKPACEADTDSMRSGCESHADSNAVSMPTTRPNPTQPNPTQPLPAEAAVKRSPSEPAIRLAFLLKSEILKNAPAFKVTMAQERAWATTADRMLRLDNRTEEEAANVICFAQRDEFWRSNILSMDTVREKFDRLAMKMKSNGNRSQNMRKSALPDSLRIGGPRAASII